MPDTQPTLTPHADVEAELTAPGAPFELVDITVRGHAMRTFKNAPTALRDVFASTARFDDRIYLVFEDERYTYREIRTQVRAVAAALQGKFGVRKGDRIAIAMRNYPESVVAFWAAASLGAVVVPLNAWWGGEELSYALADSGATVFFADAPRLEHVINRWDEFPCEQVVLVRSDEAELIPVDGTVVPWEHFAAADGSADATLPQIAPEDDATLFYTSGTTGRPKGALGTQRNIGVSVAITAYSRARALRRRGEPLPDPSQPQPQKSTLLAVPLFHVTGCHSTLVAGTAAGSKIVMMYRWNAARALELIEREKANSFGGVPTVVWQILEAPELASTDTSSIESIGYGGAPAATELVSRIAQTFPNVQPGTGYGLTESSSAVTTNSGIDYFQNPSSVGLGVPICDFKVVDGNGVACETGDTGELWIRGPAIIKGYWNRPDATEETFGDGWLRTGDIVRMDEDGLLYILDRAKEMVIRGGENVYCVEVENVLFSHPSVIDAAVFGIPHRTLGEEVAAAVQLAEGKPADAQSLQTFVREHLAGFKVPVRIALYTAPLPRNANGKILKRALRDALEGGTEHHALGEWSD